MTKTQHRIYTGFFVFFTILTTVFLSIRGYSYYLTSVEDKFFHPFHTLLKPSGIWGHGLGIIGSLMMLSGVIIYMVRKRYKKFVRIGFLKHWLELHIFLCTLGPILVLFHTSFKFGGIVSVSFWSMVAVVLSGIAGRFIYVQIPRNIQGQEYKLDELDEQNKSYTRKLKNLFSLDESRINLFEKSVVAASLREFGFFDSLKHIYQSHASNKVKLKSLEDELINKDVSKENRKDILKLMKNKLVLIRKIELLRSMQKLFKYWHVAHLPFAAIMLFIMLVHVAVTIVFGYKWIF
ncbi:MAG: hypothetical protein V1720_14030 [bacterium]